MTKLHYSPVLGTMARCTSPERCRFSHWDPEAVKPMAPIEVAGYPRVLKNSYVGVELRPEVLAPALNQLRSGMASELFELITNKKAERDGEDRYHATFIAPKEFRELRKRKEFLVPRGDAFNLSLIGVGTASNSKSQAWYAVVRSEAASGWRRQLQLPKLDFHVTLGFTDGDVHNVPKDETTLV